MKWKTEFYLVESRARLGEARGRTGASWGGS